MLKVKAQKILLNHELPPRILAKNPFVLAWSLLAFLGVLFASKGEKKKKFKENSNVFYKLLSLVLIELHVSLSQFFTLDVSSVSGSIRKPSHLKWSSYRISVFWKMSTLWNAPWQGDCGGKLISVQRCPSFLLRCELWSDWPPSTGLFQCSRENGKHTVMFSIIS